MKIPLIAKTTRDGLKIFHNGRFNYLDLPFKPFLLVEKDKFEHLKGAVEETWKKIPIDEITQYYKIEFDNINDQQDFIARHNDKIAYIYKNNYMEQLFISHEDYLLKYPHQQELTIMFWDIEVKTIGDNTFPKPKDKPIICIGFSIWKYYEDGSK